MTSWQEVFGKEAPSPADDDRPMLDQAAHLLLELREERDADARRTLATKVHELALRSRHDLRRRGSLGEPAPTPLPHSDAVASLNQVVNDMDETVRAHAVWTAGTLGDGSTLGPLGRRFSDPDPAIRIAAAVSTSDIGGPLAAMTLARLFGNPSQPSEVRFAALTSLEELATKQSKRGIDRTPSPPRDPPRSTSRARTRSPFDPPRRSSPVAAALENALGTLDPRERTSKFWEHKVRQTIPYLLSESD